jgi:hypothetical protein
MLDSVRNFIEDATMKYGNSWRLAMPFIAACILVPCAAALPQDSQDQPTQSVADAARHARDQRKAAAKSSKVITDEDIDTKNLKPGAEGLNVGAPPKLDTQPPSPAAVAAAEAADQAADSAAKEPAKRAGENPEINGLKGQIAQAAKDLDLLQRELALDQDEYFSRPDYVSDKAGKAKLDAQQRQINDKKQDLEGLKTRLAALQELEGRKKSAPAAAAPPAPAAPQP